MKTCVRTPWDIGVVPAVAEKSMNNAVSVANVASPAIRRIAQHTIRNTIARRKRVATDIIERSTEGNCAAIQVVFRIVQKQMQMVFAPRVPVVQRIITHHVP